FLARDLEVGQAHEGDQERDVDDAAAADGGRAAPAPGGGVVGDAGEGDAHVEAAAGFVGELLGRDLGGGVGGDGLEGREGGGRAGGRGPQGGFGGAGGGSRRRPGGRGRRRARRGNRRR